MHVLDFAVPVLDVLLVGESRGEKCDVMGAADPVGGHAGYGIETRFGHAMIAVDEVEMAGRDFGKQDRAREIGGGDGRLVQIGVAIVGNGGNSDGFDGKAIGVRFDERDKARDVEFEDAVAKNFFTRIDGAGLKGFREFQLGGQGVGATGGAENVGYI